MTQLIEIESTGIEGIKPPSVKLSFQVFGKPLYEAPVVLINHALTGNSCVSGEKGWWKEIVGEGKVIDTLIYSVIAFDLSGNQNHLDQTVSNGGEFFTLSQIASLQLKALKKLGIDKLFAIVGGSLGGGLAWEIWVQSPCIADNIIPIASHWLSSSWVQAICNIQEQAIHISNQNLELARKISMFFYRNSKNFSVKFKDEINSHIAGVNAISWLDYHGQALSNRMTVNAYLNVLHLLSDINVLKDEKVLDLALQTTSSRFCLIGFDSDILFPFSNIKECAEILKESGIQVSTYQVETNYGHDAFLIENEKLTQLIQPIFNKN